MMHPCDRGRRRDARARRRLEAQRRLGVPDAPARRSAASAPALARRDLRQARRRIRASTSARSISDTHRVHSSPEDCARTLRSGRFFLVRSRAQLPSVPIAARYRIERHSAFQFGRRFSDALPDAAGASPARDIKEIEHVELRNPGAPASSLAGLLARPLSAGSAMAGECPADQMSVDVREAVAVRAGRRHRQCARRARRSPRKARCWPTARCGCASW